MISLTNLQQTCFNCAFMAVYITSVFLPQELAKDGMKTAFQLKADFEAHQREKELEDEIFRRTTEMREEVDLNNNMVSANSVAVCCL